jgi:hypothetical protein
MQFKCVNCGKSIKVWEKAYFEFRLPERSTTELQAFLRNEAKVYCTDCIKIMRASNNRAVKDMHN